jgi:uncharacterized repeat protein (TIGR01451 family)
MSPIVCTISGDATIATLAPGASETCSSTYAITQADIDAGSRANLATAAGEDPGGNPVSDSDPHDEPLQPGPAIDLDKTGSLDDGGDGATVGDIITYTFVVTNTGNVTLSNIVVSDPLAGMSPIVCTISGDATIATLAPGGSETCSSTYAITQADIDAGSRANLATAAGEDPGGNPVSDTDPHDEPLQPGPAIGIVKTAIPQTYSAVGEVITYNYVVTNTGNVTINQPITIDDDIATDESCPNTPASLAPTETINCTASHTISQADLDSGSVTNVAFATGQDPDRNPVTSLTDDETVTVVRVNLAKTVNGPAQLQPNGTYTVLYTITATNLGGGPGVYDLVDTFSPGSGITLNTATAAYLGGSEIDQNGLLGAYPNFVTGEGLADGLNESWTVTANFTVDPAQVDPIDSQCDPGQPVINTGFYNAVSGSDTETDTDDNDTCTGLPQPGINLAKTVNGPAMLQPNGTYTVLYTVTASNNGDGPGMYNIVDTFSPGSGITLNTATIAYGGGNDVQDTTPGPYPNFVTGESLGAGNTEFWTVTANFLVDPSQVDPADSQCDPGDPVIDTGFYNRVEGVDGEENTDDNDTCTSLLQPGINLAKTVNGPAVLQPDGSYDVLYTVTASNGGDGPGTYDIVDTFSPGSGITLNTATIAYGGGNDVQDTTPGPYPNFVTGESLGAGNTEFWTITANFLVDPSQVDPADSQCDPGDPVIDTGFYNRVEGVDGESDTDDNDTCTGLPDPVIDLSKDALNVQDNGDGSYTVTYRVTASNLGDGPGFYDLTDTIDPGNGISVTQAQLTDYVPGSEDSQTGALSGPLPYSFTSPGTLVTGEALAGKRDESWTIVVEFFVDETQTDETLRCSSVEGGAGTGFFNLIEGSASDPDLGNNTACDDPPEEGGNARFMVTKYFSDLNPQDVKVFIKCDTGLPLEQEFIINHGEDNGVTFVVTSFISGEMNCSIREEPVPMGYVPTYSQEQSSSQGTPDAAGCHYDNVEAGALNYCRIDNELQEVTVYAEKVWVDAGNSLQYARFELECSKTMHTPRTLDGDGFVSWTFLPSWDGDVCNIVETSLQDASDIISEANSYCFNQEVGPGFDYDGDIHDPDSDVNWCVWTNTWFYEGIPTLNQYGLMLMILLMFGVGGFVARRYG